MRRRNEVADEDQSRYERDRRSEVQNLRLRLGGRQIVTCGGMGEGQDGRRSVEHQEHGYRSRTRASAGQDSLLGSRRRRHQGGNRRLEEEARHRSSGARKGWRALTVRFRDGNTRNNFDKRSDRSEEHTSEL